MQTAITLHTDPVRSGAFLARADRVFVALCAAIFTVLIGFYLAEPFGFESPYRDTWHHLAVLRELIANPFDPSNPHLPTDEASRYFTPPNILTALIAKLFGISPFWAFSYMSAANCLAFCVVCWLFAKRYYRSEYAPSIFLGVLLFAWGTQRGHAGFHNFATFISSAGYPATQALTLGIFTWYLSLTASESQDKIRSQAALLAIVSAITIITHQFSAFVMLTGAGSLVLFHRTADAKRKAIVLGSLFVGGLLSLAWPYFNPLTVVTSASDPRWSTAARVLETLVFPLMLVVPALFGLAGLRDRTLGIRWEILVPILFFVSSYVALFAAEASIAHRFTPAIMLYLQLGLVWAFIDFDYGKSSDKTKTLHGIAIMTLLVLGLMQAVDPRIKEFTHRAEVGRFMALVDEIENDLPEDSITFTSDTIVFPVQSTGRRVVSIPRPEPVAPSLSERQQATDLFFARDTSAAKRQALIEQWDATHAVFAVTDLDPQTTANLRKLGPSKTYHRNGEIVLVSIGGSEK